MDGNTALIIALIGILGTLFAAELGYRNSRKILEATLDHQCKEAERERTFRVITEQLPRLARLSQNVPHPLKLTGPEWYDEWNEVTCILGLVCSEEVDVLICESRSLSFDVATEEITSPRFLATSLKIIENLHQIRRLLRAELELAPK